MTLNVYLRTAAFLLVAAVSADAVPKKLNASERRLLEKLVLAEAASEGTVGMALVARSVLNRTALVATRKLPPGTYMARGRTVRHIILARKQYEPVSNGSINRRRSKAQMARARESVFLGQDTAKLNQALAKLGVSQSARKRLLHATGFRTKTAFKDKSQMHNRQVFRRHVFNSDKFAKKIDVVAVYAKYWGGSAGPGNLTGTNSGGSSGSSTAGLQRGDRGSAVRALQAALNKRGSSVAVDGVFGPATQAALEAFQKKNKLSPSGRVDEATQQTLSGRPPALGMAAGARGDEVRVLQGALNRRGANLKVDGVFGPETEEALKTYQRESQLSPTGRLDQQTLRAFRQPAFSLPLGLERGASGRNVRTLQAELNERGAKLKVDGVFGSGTQIALRTFQEAHQLEVNGKLDLATFRALLKK